MHFQNPTNSSVKRTSNIFVLVSALLLGVTTQVSADNITASFERMLNPAKTVIQPTISYQAESDPLYTMVNAKLWGTPAYHDNSTPTGYETIAASFEHMLNPVETANRSVVAYRVVQDPLYHQINAMLWNTPVTDETVAVISPQGMLIIATCGSGNCQPGLIR